MQQFTVPQFIDVEAKIIGPITGRQFIIMLSGLLVIAACYKLLDFAAFVTATIFIFIISVVFSFVKINGRPFHYFLLNIIQTLKKAKLRTWNNGLVYYLFEYDGEEAVKKNEIYARIEAKHYSTSRLAELSLMVDTGGVYRGKKQNGEEIIEVIK